MAKTGRQLQVDIAKVDATIPAIEDVLADLAKDVPDEEWDRLPRDLTDKLDYYLYGGMDDDTSTDGFNNDGD